MGKQNEIPGTERPQIQEIDVAAEAYQEAKTKRMKLTEKEAAAKLSLIAVMKKHAIDVYRDENASPPLVVTLKPGKDNVQVSEIEDEGPDADETGEDYQ